MKPEHRKEVQRKLNEAENFFKHAKRDPDGMLRFKPIATEYLILDACFKYYDLTGEIIPLCSAFVKWFQLNHPNLFNLTLEQKAFYKRFDEEKPTRQAFLSVVLPLEYQFGQ